MFESGIVGNRREGVEKPGASDADHGKKVSSLCSIEALAKEIHTHTNVVDVQKARCGVVWNLAAGALSPSCRTRAMAVWTRCFPST